MNTFREAVKSCLEHDSIIMSFVGYSDYPTMEIPNIHEDIAPKGTQAPFVVWQIIPGGDTPDGTFGDDMAIVYFIVQFSCWGRTRNEAWQLNDAVEEALNNRDFDADLVLYSLMRKKRQGNPFPLPDQDTSWTQVATTYEFALGR